MIIKEVVNHIITRLNLFFIFHRERNPAAQQTRAHRRHRLINDVNESLSVRVRGADKL